MEWRHGKGVFDKKVAYTSVAFCGAFDLPLVLVFYTSLFQKAEPNVINADKAIINININLAGFVFLPLPLPCSYPI